ncbi:MAG: SDR family NAD(P)-dependent oxidoreductase [Gemmatimonadetes bacterium]|nr:SDR family NAD(P)-dependent oxidoreductase [Gemmatimonadota bacterium]
MDRPIRDQVVVITGASSGIGRCTALHLAGLGASVVLTARRADALEQVVREIRAGGGRAIAVPGEVTRADDLRAVADAAVQRFGRIDTWVNNAGVYLQGRVQDISLDEYRRVLDVNFVGLVNGTQRALEVMLPRGEGVIVQVSSVAAKRGVPFTSPYSASKAAVAAFASALRAELLGSGVRLSVLYPPSVDTPIYDSARGKLGVAPKPAAPIYDPLSAARAIEHLARTGERERYFGWAGPLAALDAASPALGDWLLHRVAGFTYSDAPAHADDNLDSPARTIPPAVRAGWARPGWRGLTVRESVRVLPVESMLAAAALGFVCARAARRLRALV